MTTENETWRNASSAENAGADREENQTNKENGYPRTPYNREGGARPYIAATVLIARVSIRTPRTGASVRNARIAATALIARASTRMPKTAASARNAFIVRNNVLTATSNALMATNNALMAAMSSVLIVRAIIMRTLTVRNALTTQTVRPMAMPTVRCVRVIIT